jgi:hypothetical protein
LLAGRLPEERAAAQSEIRGIWLSLGDETGARTRFRRCERLRR